MGDIHLIRVEFYSDHFLMALGFAAVGQGNNCQSTTHAGTKVALVYLAMQGIGCAGVDEVPVHIKHAADALLVGIHLSVLLVVKGLQLHNLAILPIATFVVLVHVVELGIERQHVQVYRLALDDFLGGQHVADKLASGGSGGVHTYAYFGLFECLGLLRLGAGGALGSALLRVEFYSRLPGGGCRSGSHVW